MFEISTNFLQDKIFLSLYKLAIIRQLKILLVYRTLSGLEVTQIYIQIFQVFGNPLRPLSEPRPSGSEKLP